MGKAFEEWKGPGFYWGQDPSDRPGLDQARRGWRAALEWLRDNEDAHCCGDCDAVGDWTDCPKNTAIKEELENTDGS